MREESIREGRAGFRPTSRCVYSVYLLGRIIYRRKDAGLTTCCFSLDVQKAQNIVGRNELRKESWETRIRGKIRIMVKKMTMSHKYDVARWRNFEIFSYFGRSCKWMDVVTLYSRHLFMS